MNTADARIWALALPKAEQHVHDVGSMPVDMLNALAERYGATSELPPGLAAGSFSFEGEGLPGFVAMYVAACTVVRGGEDYEALGKRISLDMALQNTQYARIHHTPAIPGARDGLWDEPLEGLLAGFKEGHKQGGALCHVIIDIPAEFDGFYPDNDFRDRSAGEAVKYRCTDPSVPGVVGIGCAGDESKTDFSTYISMVQSGRDAGLEVVVHAGESQGQHSLRDALAHVKPDRIEHGIGAILDDDICQQLVESKTPLDMAIVSNFLLSNLGALGISEHPLRALYERGATITLSTDDPTMFRTDLNNEYAAALELGLGAEDVCQLAINAWSDPFAPESMRKEAEARISAIASADPQEVIAEVRASMLDQLNAYENYAKANDTTMPPLSIS